MGREGGAIIRSYVVKTLQIWLVQVHVKWGIYKPMQCVMTDDDLGLRGISCQMIQ